MTSQYKKDLIEIYYGDARDLISNVKSHSIDIIFTDPPYQKKYLYLYEWLSEIAPIVLKPQGFLLTYCGGYYKNLIMATLGKNLDYFWDFSLKMNGNNSIIWPRKIIARSKSILCYNLKDSKALPNTNVLGHWESGGGEDKRFHVWGQDEQTARYYISCFSDEASTILEPFSGGGTTPFVCRVLKRKCIAFEVEQEYYLTTVSRIENTPKPLKYEQIPLEI